jgi:hypothetical protein
MIMATKIPQSPKNIFEEIICDADLDYLGRDDYDANSSGLLQEIELSKKLNRKDWIKLQVSFLNQHAYFTNSSKKLRSPKKEIILKQLLETTK